VTLLNNLVAIDGKSSFCFFSVNLEDGKSENKDNLLPRQSDF
jgi:hypothetical protein